MSGRREPCPSWCVHHSAARCRSEPFPVMFGAGVRRGGLALQLERWHGREVALAIIPAPEHMGPLLLPQVPALEVWAAMCALVTAAGWVPEVASLG